MANNRLWRTVLLSLVVFVLAACAAATHPSSTSRVRFRTTQQFPFPSFWADTLRSTRFLLVDPQGVAWVDTATSKPSRHVGQSCVISVVQPTESTLLQRAAKDPLHLLHDNTDTNVLLLAASFDTDTLLFYHFKLAGFANNGSFVPEQLLVDARKRWIGKFLWTSILTSPEDFDDSLLKPIHPVYLPQDFEKVRVGDIQPSQLSARPFRFTIVNDSGRVYHVTCALQADDPLSGNLAAPHAFGLLLREADPMTDLEYVSDEYPKDGEPAWTIDSATFVRTLGDSVNFRWTTLLGQSVATARNAKMLGHTFVVVSVGFERGSFRDLMCFQSKEDGSEIYNWLVSLHGQPSETRWIHQDSTDRVAKWFYLTPSNRTRQIVFLNQKGHATVGYENALEQ